MTFKGGSFGNRTWLNKTWGQKYLVCLVLSVSNKTYLNDSVPWTTQTLTNPKTSSSSEALEYLGNCKHDFPGTLIKTCEPRHPKLCRNWFELFILPSSATFLTDISFFKNNRLVKLLLGIIHKLSRGEHVGDMGVTSWIISECNVDFKYWMLIHPYQSFHIWVCLDSVPFAHHFTWIMMLSIFTS